MPIAERIAKIQKLIAATAESCQRPPKGIQLLAVSKGQPASAIAEAVAAGVINIGENYLQEAKTKIPVLRQLPICWHFIGPIQSNKAEEIAQEFNWVHSVSRKKIAKLLSQHRPSHLPALQVCLQVNLDEEETKAGVSQHQLPELALIVHQLPHLKLRGLMAIPKPQLDEQQQYESLLRLAKLFNQLNQNLGLGMDTLSMGMTDDLVAAIRAGSTMVRIGRAIFGERGSK